jgi:hypothetical protein
MKNSLWVVILVVLSFMGFMMGYSLPPMFEVGLIGGTGEQEIGVKSEMSDEMDEYYKQLLKDTEE